MESNLEFDFDNDFQGYLKINLIFWRETFFYDFGNWRGRSKFC